MKLLIHDYGGYGFTVQLGRQLARRGHEVCYLYGDSTQLVKRGAFARQPSDPPNLAIQGISLSQPFQKYSLIRRRAQEIEYGRCLAEKIVAQRPDVVISGNTPLDTQAIALDSARACGARFVFWLQDLIGLATYKILTKKHKLLGHTIGRYYMGLERLLLRRSDGVILIAEDFRPIVEKLDVRPGRITTLSNWAPLDELPRHPRQNPWAQAHGLSTCFTFLYSGVLALKHNPDLLLQLALHWKTRDHVKIVVVSQGPGADWLRQKCAENSLDNLLVLDFHSHDQFPHVLASADVLLTLLEADAGVFSVPSKVLTYLCAGRPLLLAVPPENLAARIVCQHAAGLVVSPGDLTGWITASETLYADQELRRKFAARAVQYADQHFDIQRITDRFEEILYLGKEETIALSLGSIAVQK